MDHKREHRTPPTSKGHGSGVDNNMLWFVIDVVCVKKKVNINT